MITPAEQKQKFTYDDYLKTPDGKRYELIVSIIGEKNVQGAPNPVVEIISEATAYNDLIKRV